MNREGTSPTSVLYIDNSFTFGGAINALATLLKGLDRRRFRPVVLSAQEPRVLDDLFPDAETVHWAAKLPWVEKRLHKRVRQWPGFRSGPLRFLWDKAVALWWILAVEVPQTIYFIRTYRRHGIDIVHLNNGVNGMLPAILAAKLLRLPVVAHARGPVTTTGFRRRHYYLPDHWIAVSGSIAGNLEAAGVPRKDLTVIHDAIDVAEFEVEDPERPIREELGIPSGAPVVGAFGRIIPWKGIREFVRAVERVRAEIPDLHALVVGDPSDGAPGYYRDVVGLVEELGIADRVHFTGFRSDVAELMSACDVVAHTSTAAEPFGLTVIEGMATGTPVVAASSGGPVEIIDPERTGLLADPEDTAAFAAAIVRLLTDSELARAIGTRGSQRVREFYSAARYAADVTRLYERFGWDARPQ